MSQICRSKTFQKFPNIHLLNHVWPMNIGKLKTSVILEDLQYEAGLRWPTSHSALRHGVGGAQAVRFPHQVG